jgi:hypothetical protein
LEELGLDEFEVDQALEDYQDQYGESLWNGINQYTIWMIKRLFNTMVKSGTM